MEKLKVGVIGGTGMVGQRYVTLIANHPWFELAAIVASARSAAKPMRRPWALSGLLTTPCLSARRSSSSRTPRTSRRGKRRRFCLLRRRYEERGDPRARGGVRQGRVPLSSPTTAPTAGPRTCRWSYPR